MIEEYLGQALDQVDLGPDVLEVGPGPGFTTDILRHKTKSLTAVEIDPALFDSLSERLAKSNVQVLLGDATALELPDDFFSAATSFHMLHHVPTLDAQQRVLAELARVLRPGGLLVAADSGYSKDTHLFHQDDIYNPIEPDILPDRLAAVGFTSVDVQRYDLHRWICTARAA